MMVLRIAFFTDAFYPQINGVSNTLLYLSQYLREHQIEHLFFAPDYEGEERDDARIPVVRYKGIRPPICPECCLAFPSSAKVHQALADFRPDVVHIVTEQGIGWAGLRAARALNIPIVMSYHTNFDKYLDFYHLKYLNKAVTAYMKWFHNFALVNLCPSTNTLLNLQKQGFTRLDIWSRGIDLKRFHPAHFSEEARKLMGGKDKTVFLYVGRIAAEKGLDIYFQSIKAINEEYGAQLQFVFTGEGPYLDELMAQQIPNIIFTGPKRGQELAAIYASADAFVFPSGTETFGNVLLEAMASGLPVVCADAGGVTDFTENNENAFVFKNGDTIDLTHALRKMLNPQFRAAIRRKALETARSRSWETIFDGLMFHYESAVQGMLLPQAK